MSRDPSLDESTLDAARRLQGALRGATTLLTPGSSACSISVDAARGLVLEARRLADELVRHLEQASAPEVIVASRAVRP
jgi:hypothetical protein